MEKMKKDIKIFVSHRIDLDSETIGNPLYVPVRCGAVYDKRKNVTMLGDDTGDNISEKRNSFCELTVLYWAWKNIKADYYGLCHYRRYISFSQKKYMHANNGAGFVTEEYLDKNAINKYCLNEKIMTEEIEKYDLIITPEEDTRLAWDGPHKTVYDMCNNRKRDFDINGVNKVIEIINRSYPEFSKYAKIYFNGHKVRFYNCFVMKAELFKKFCEFLFGILFELENELNTENYNKWKERMPGFMGEDIFGIFCLYLNDQKKYKIKTNELVMFLNTEKVKELHPAFTSNNYPIVFGSSNYFVPYASVFIKSIINNSKSQNNYDIIILENDISKNNKTILLDMIKNNRNFSIRFYNPKSLINNVKFYINAKSQSEVAYYRVLAPYILKNYEDKAVVMDCDLIVLRDIADIFNTNLNNNIAAIAKDVVWHSWFNGDNETIRNYNKNILKMKKPLNYVNTGVILFDCKKYRENYSMDFVIDFMTKENYMIQEQDALNAMLEGRICFLDIKWNMYAMVSEFIEKSIEDYASVTEKNEYYIAHNDPYIIHWAAHPKPWSVPEIDLAFKWWTAARESPFYEVIISRLSNERAYSIATQFNNNMVNKIIKCLNKQKIKNFIKIFFPTGSKRHALLKRWYFKLKS